MIEEIIIILFKIGIYYIYFGLVIIIGTGNCILTKEEIDLSIKFNETKITLFYKKTINTNEKNNYKNIDEYNKNLYAYLNFRIARLCKIFISTGAWLAVLGYIFLYWIIS